MNAPNETQATRRALRNEIMFTKYVSKKNSFLKDSIYHLQFVLKLRFGLYRPATEVKTLSTEKLNPDSGSICSDTRTEAVTVFYTDLVSYLLLSQSLRLSSVGGAVSDSKL